MLIVVVSPWNTLPQSSIGSFGRLVGFCLVSDFPNTIFRLTGGDQMDLPSASEKVGGSNLRFTGHFGGKRHLDVFGPVTIPDLV